MITQKEEMEPLSPYSALFTPVRECTFDTFSEQCSKFQWTVVGWCVYYLTKEIVKESKIGFCASAQAIHSGRLTIYPTTEVQADSL